MLIPGQTVGDRYKLVKFLNRGGMADVWTAVDEQAKPQKKVVAIKVMRDPVPMMAERFAREAEIQLRLSSPYIVPLYDSGEYVYDNGQRFFYCVFPYVAQGRTLEHVISEAEPQRDVATGRILGTAIEEKRLIDILIQAGTGLRDAHRSNPPVVHRDFKPSNVFVQAISIGKERILVGDWGIARLNELTQEDPRAKLTRVGALGTRMYMARQQAYGPSEDPAVDAKRYDLRNDIYSFGVTAYEAITKHNPHPFEEKGETQVFAEVLAGRRATPIETYCIGVNPRLAAIVMKCLEPEQEDRPRDMDEVLAVLSDLLFADNSFNSIQPPGISASVPPLSGPKTLTPSEVQIEIGKAETMADPLSLPPPKRDTPSQRETVSAPDSYPGGAVGSGIPRSRMALLLALALIAMGMVTWIGIGYLPAETAPSLAAVPAGTRSAFGPIVLPVIEVQPSASLTATAPNTGPAPEASSVAAAASAVPAPSETVAKKPPKHGHGGYGGNYAAPPPTVMYPELRDPSALH